MISPEVIAIITLLYCGLVFWIAFYAEKRQEQGRSLTNNVYVYSASLTVYVTALSFYGGVGRAATSGLDYLPLYLGPTLMAFTWWFLLRKLIRVCRNQNIVSLADFIAGRYDKSALLGSLVTLFAVMGIMPYTALQLKAVSYTFDLLTTPNLTRTAGDLSFFQSLTSGIDSAMLFALILALFSILFGARQLDAGHRHAGLMAVLAFETLFKLVIFLALGLFVTYGLFDGFGDIFSRFFANFPDRHHLLLLDTPQTSYAKWFSMTLLSMMGVMFLPRQFQVAVIENSSESHVYGAMWRFPTYLFLFNIFVLPVALGGLLLSGGSTMNADFFVLTLPLEAGHTWLAAVVFIGGFSASAGMIMFSTVALSTMILNHIIMPVVLHFHFKQADISGLLINLKRLSIILVVFLGYWCYRLIGESYALVNMGLMSFVAAVQFAPAIIGGLYWPRANRLGALTGLSLGFLVWIYTLFIPSLVRSGWLESDLMETGLFNIHLLRPQELFGLQGFDMWTHSLFWSLLFNLLAFILFSLLTPQSDSERELMRKYCELEDFDEEKQSRKRMSRAPTIMEFVALMTKFIGEKPAHAAIASYLGEREIDAQGRLSDFEIPGLKRFTEKTLAGHVGAAPARIIIENYLSARGSRMEDVFDIFGSVSLSRVSGREQLSVLYEVAREVAANKDLKTTVESVLELLRSQFKFDLCVLRVLDSEESTLKVHSQRGMSSEHLGQLEPIADMETYLGQAFLTGEVTVVNDTDFLDKPRSAQIVHQEGIKSFAHAPVVLEGSAIGILSAFSRTAKGIFTEEFIELFTNIAGQIAVAWRNDRQTAQLLSAREQEKELEIAKTIQMGLLPTREPDIPGVSIKGTYVAAKQVGGDYYDFIQRPDGRMDLLIADVSGHNIGAALIMAETRTFIRAKSREIDEPADLLHNVNNFFYKDLTRAELFITLFYLQYNTATRELAYSNAGHNQPLLWRNARQEVEWLDSEGMILGITKGIEFEEKITPLEAGDVLVLYTDGITEAENMSGDFFGRERLASVIREHHHSSAEMINHRIVQEAASFSGLRNFNDDVTLVVMRIDG